MKDLILFMAFGAISFVLGFVVCVVIVMHPVNLDALCEGRPY